MKSKSWLKEVIGKSAVSLVLIFVSLCLYAQPVAKFSGTTLSGCAPILVHFSDESTGNPSYWKWELGNGTVSYLQNPSLTYFAPGTYTIKLIVKNSSGQDSAIKTNYVVVNAAPVVNFTASQTTGCNTVSANFTNLSTPADTWQWDFGDGELSEQQNPGHIYTQTGNYNVSFKVTNSNGCTATMLKQDYVRVSAVKADFTNSVTERCLPTKITFQNNSSGNGTLGYKWLFGNGDSSLVKNPQYNYPTGGNYTVKLLVRNEFGCQDTLSKNITVGTPVSAAFTADLTSSCTAPARIQFTNQVLSGNTCYWHFGDTTATGSNPLHIYKDTGMYTVKLLVKNNGCVDSVIKTGYIRIQKPFVSFDNLPDSGCTAFTKKLSASLSGSDSVVAYLWKFGDGETSTAVSPSHNYSSEGYFNVTLITTGISGCSDTSVAMKAIRTGKRPAAAFSAPVRNGCAQTGLNFTDLSSGNITEWEWDFGDNTQETVQHPTHKFVDTGFLAVQLIVSNGGCHDTLKQNRYVYIKPSISKFKFDFGCDAPFTFSFTNFSVGADHWKWDFGDGNTSTSLNPVHTYRDTGLYFVSLSTLNDATGCDNLRTKFLEAVHITPNFFASDTSICKGGEIKFTSTIPSDNASRFMWDFGDGTTENTHENHVTHTYNRPGNYAVRLITINLINCRDTVTKINYISVNALKANFRTVTTIACANTKVVFHDSSTTEGANVIKSWQWDYGDGRLDTLYQPPFSHTYSNRGSFPVSLKVTDNKGCSDLYVLDEPLVIKKLNAMFFAYDTVKCTNSPVNFICPYAEPGTSYRWDFGDGGDSTGQRPYHRYTAEGNYTVKMKISHVAGCEDSSTLTSYIKIENPGAKFNMSDSFRTCPPLIVLFTNESVNRIDERWDFGDGSTTGIQDPSHFYSYPGIYTASLTVKGRGGCSSKMQKTIIVKGPKGSLRYTPLNFCSPSEVNFIARTIDAASFVWDFNDGSTVSNTDSVIMHRYGNTGKFVPKLMLVDNNACKVPISGADTINMVSVESRFEFPTKIFCSADNVSFINTSLSSENILNTRWNFGDGSYVDNLADASHDYLLPGAYYPSLVVTTASGCTDSFSTPNPVKVVAAPGADIQLSGNGCTPLTAPFNSVITNSTVPISNWQWEFGNGKTSSQQNPPAQIYLEAGSYTVKLTVTSSEGCERIITKNIQAYELPVVDAGNDKTITNGSSVELVPTVSADVIEVKWSPTGSIFRSSDNAIIVKPGVTTEYTAVAKNIAGCTASDKLNVIVSDAASGIFIPNTFSPNGDGANEIFYPRAPGSIKVTRFKIFNREGVTVFEKNNFYTNDAASGWNGTLKGVKLASNVYVFAIEIAGSNGKPYVISGNVSLLR